MDPQQKAIAEEFDLYQRTYSDAVNDALAFSGLRVDFFTRVKAEYLIDLVTAQFSKTSDLSVLDVGCGVGNYHQLLKGRIGKLTGIDVSEGCVREAKTANPDVHYDTYDGASLPYPANTFDVAFTICVMHHVPPAHWDRFVSEIYRVLKPGGMAIVFEHNPKNPLTLRVVNRCPFDRDAVLLPAGTTAERFDKAFFNDVKARFILTLPAGNSALRKLDRFFAHIPIGAQYYVTALKSR